MGKAVQDANNGARDDAVRPPLPVTVLTGFLGAGKTTLLKTLLGRPHGLRIALVLNEMGQAGIDVGTPAETSTVELTEGCVCCLRNPDLLRAMDELWARGDIDRVILETTGLADPLALTWTLARRELAGKVRLDAVVTVVDPGNWEASAGEEWEAQVRCGDLVVLSKVDLFSPAIQQRAVAAVQAINPQARILPGEGLPTEILLDALPDVTRPRAFEQEPVEHGRHSSFGVLTISGAERWRLDPLEDLLEELPGEVFRGKGIVRLEDDRWAAFHVVGGRLQLELGAPAPAHGESRIALFGRQLDRASLEARLRACQV